MCSSTGSPEAVDARLGRGGIASASRISGDTSRRVSSSGISSRSESSFGITMYVIASSVKYGI